MLHHFCTSFITTEVSCKVISLWHNYSMKHLPTHLRPREKLVSLGADNLTDNELYAILLGSGIKGRSVSKVASQIVAIMKKKLSAISIKDLQSIKGLGIAKSSTIIAALELGKRLHSPHKRTYIQSPADVLPFVSELLESRQEHLVALYLNARSEVLHKALISKGTATASIAHPRDIFWPAIEHSAVHIILIHNHPSGSLTPSSEDLEMTMNVRKGSELLGFTLLDHIIVSKEGYQSIG